MRLMSGRAIRIIARIIFLLCGLTTLFTAVPYAMLQGTDLPFQSEWVVFVAGLGLVGGFSVLIGVLPYSLIEKVCGKPPENESSLCVPFKLLGGFAVAFYLFALFAYFAPHTWNLSPQLMLCLCPMYLVRMTFDPSPLGILLMLAPMNAAVYGSLGLALGCVWLAFHREKQAAHFGDRRQSIDCSTESRMKRKS
jgi:uncharacterized membrane protein YuzA (DUF378 family)